MIQELHCILADPCSPDEITQGIILATAVFCDEKIGPFRTKRLMQAAPDIVLRWDAYVTDEAAALFAPVLQAFSKHLLEVTPHQRSPIGKPEIAAA